MSTARNHSGLGVRPGAAPPTGASRGNLPSIWEGQTSVVLSLMNKVTVGHSSSQPLSYNRVSKQLAGGYLGSHGYPLLRGPLASLRSPCLLPTVGRVQAVWINLTRGERRVRGLGVHQP